MGDISSLKKIESGQEVVRPFSAYNLKRNDTVLSTDNAPFLYRPIPPLSTPYVREKLVGASVAWNQLVGSSDTSVTVTSGHKYALYKNSAWSVGISDGTAISVTGGTDMCIDLTLAFGTAIADRIYSMEQASAGSGITWIKSYGFLTEPYYAYGSGIQSVCVDRKVIKDADDTVETTISLGHDELRGVPKLDSNNEIYYDGDEKTADGTIIRRYNITNLGERTWTKNGNNKQYYSSLHYAKNLTSDMRLSTGKYIPTTNGAYNMTDKNISIVSDFLWITDSDYDTADALKTSLSGVYLVYPLATPTTEQSTPFTSPQYLFDGGTEEFVDYPYEQETRDVAVPVGHVTEYLGASTDIKDKFYLPALPDADGEYKLTAKIQNGVLVEAKWDNENLIDDTTKTEFKLGIDNGLLYIEEV